MNALLVDAPAPQQKATSAPIRELPELEMLSNIQDGDSGSDVSSVIEKNEILGYVLLIRREVLFLLRIVL